LRNFEYQRGRQPAAPPGPRPFDPFLSAENQGLSPHPGSSFPDFQPTMKAPPHKEEPLFLVISSYTTREEDFPRFFFFLTAVGRGPRLPNLTSFSHSHHQPCPSHRHFPCHFSLPPLPLHPHSRPPQASRLPLTSPPWIFFSTPSTAQPALSP